MHAHAHRHRSHIVFAHLLLSYFEEKGAVSPVRLHANN